MQTKSTLTKAALTNIDKMRGSLIGIGTTNKEELTITVKEMNSQIVILENANIEKIEDVLKQPETNVIMLLEGDKLTWELRCLAKQHEKTIIMAVSLPEKINSRLAMVSDFRTLALEAETGLLIGITDTGVSVVKNRFGDRDEMKIAK